MKNNFYVHDVNDVVDLKNHSNILKFDWNKRIDLIYPEATTYYEIYTRQDYIQSDCKILPGDVVVDCGGNIGIFTSFA